MWSRFGTVPGFCIALLCVVSAAGRLRTAHRAQLEGQTTFTSSSIQKVITMLENLISEMDAERAQDETQFQEFSAWCSAQQAATGGSVDELQGKVDDLGSALTDFYARKAKLETQVQKLSSEVADNKAQVQGASERRKEENDEFVKDQSDFDSSITACSKAIELLKAHYGDGSSSKTEKPAWMGFVQKTLDDSKAVLRRHKRIHMRPRILALLQQPSMSDRYEASSGEALNIVDQMQLLRDTFQEDKQSAAEEEKRLQSVYDHLMSEKAEQIQTLTVERDSRQSVLNQVNQDLGETESAKANAEAELRDEQGYFAAVQKQCNDGEILFNMRKKDRDQEKTATQEAIKVLQPQVSFAQTLVSNRPHHHRHHRVKHRSGSYTQNCADCQRAAALLSSAAQATHSDLLAKAAAATMSSDTMTDVIDSLGDMVKRLDEEEAMEEKHKEWCEGEVSDTSDKKTAHETQASSFAQKISDATAVIAETQQKLTENADAIARADKNFADATAIREKGESEFAVELQNYKDAIAALNTAIDMLAKAYAAQGAGDASALQLQSDAAPREVAPGMFDGAYENKGGSGVVQMISAVRKEFEGGKKTLEEGEAEAVSDFSALKIKYNAARTDLLSVQDGLNAKLQSAEASLETFREDKANHETEAAAADQYLGQLAQSCKSLLQHFGERVRLRREEKSAIKEAIKVLRDQ